MQNQTIERTTLTNLLNNEDYTRKVLPFIKSEYFNDKTERIIFDEMKVSHRYKKI
jgi:replicative DNA helicase